MRVPSSRRFAAPVLLLASALAAGCQPPRERIEVPRLRAGDTLTPVLYLAEPWRAGTTTPVQARLRVEGDAPRHLKLGEVSGDGLTRLAVTYYRGDEPLGPPLELPMHEFC